MEGSGGLQSIASHRVGHDWSDLSRTRGSSVLHFLKKLHIVVHSDYTNLYSHHRAQGLPVSTSSPAFVIPCLLYTGHSNTCKMMPHYGFGLHFLDI